MKQYVATIDATHGGFINGNNSWYLEDQMSNATETWLVPYEKPVLTHHDSKKDAIGYVIDAQYVPTKNSDRDKPQGFIRLKTVISDMDAVQKIKDGRYRTVSITADAKYARCSICKQLIHKDGLCDHTRGKVYDGQKCFWFIGDLKYKEVSPVNMPADEFAKIVKIEELEIDGMKMSDEEKEKSISDFHSMKRKKQVLAMSKMNNKITMTKKSKTIMTH